MNSYLLKNASLYRNQKFENTDILIIDGKIKEIAPDIQTDICTYDLKGKMVSHNFIDIHTHLREPGFEHKETIATGSLSALYGGYGTIVATVSYTHLIPKAKDLEPIQMGFCLVYLVQIMVQILFHKQL